MTWRRLFAILLAVALGAGAWRAGGWSGLALMGSALVLWALLYYNQIMTVMRRAADRPVGYVGSAVMLNAKLQAGQPLLKVLAMTRALGQPLTEVGVDPEVYRWTDPGGSFVTAEFRGGKLLQWKLERPAPETAPDPAAGPPGEA
ncbi:glycerate kinase [Ottowia pentelensis]|uniref:Glycerate kinase n=1 Tax=Ottowia pentelensis TaxID=511108 RepID=A0ABV6PU84_9BURK